MNKKRYVIDDGSLLKERIIHSSGDTELTFRPGLHCVSDSTHLENGITFVLPNRLWAEFTDRLLLLDTEKQPFHLDVIEQEGVHNIVLVSVS